MVHIYICILHVLDILLHSYTLFMILDRLKLLLGLEDDEVPLNRG